MKPNTLERTRPSAAASPGHPSQEGRSEVHFGYLDGLRGLAALYVILHHASIYNSAPWPSAVEGSFAKLFAYGHYAVDIFIVLSGFCLMVPVSNRGGVLRGGAAKFFQRRATRILPTYFASLAVCIALISTILRGNTTSLWGSVMPVSKGAILKHVFLVQDLFKNSHSINYVLWSISIEWRIYFLFPLLVLAVAKFGGMRTALIACVASFALLIPLRFTPINTGPFGLNPGYIGLFCLGMMACDLGIGVASDRALSKRFLYGSLVAGTVLLFGLGFAYDRYAQLLSFLVGLLAALLLVAVSRGMARPIHKLLSWQPIAWLGTFGYSLYLFHPPLLQVLWLKVIHPLGFGPAAEQALMVLATPLIVLGCYVAYLLFERPILRWREGAKPARVAQLAT